MKKLVSLILSFVIIFSNVTCVFASETVTTTQYKQGKYTKVKSVKVVDKSLDTDKLSSLKGTSNDSYTVPTFDWDKLENRYYYSLLSSKRRELYDKIYTICDSYLRGNLTANKKNYGTKKHPEYVYRISKSVDNSNETYSFNDISVVFNVFYYENPEFFFLYPTLYFTKNNKIVFTVYEKFSTKDGLVKAEKRVINELNGYIEDINRNVNLKVQDEIAWYLARKIYKNIPYDDDGMNILIEKDIDKHYTQSIYSALVLKKTVCAGYSKLYSALMNYFGIDTIAVLGPAHAWNQVKFDNKWYTVDLTQCLDCGDFYYLPTRSQLKEYDRIFYYSTSIHKLLNYYKKYAPTTSNKEYVKTYLPVEVEPTIEIVTDEESGKRFLTINSVENAVIQYSWNKGDYEYYNGPVELDATKNYLIKAKAKVTNVSLWSKENVLYVTKVEIPIRHNILD